MPRRSNDFQALVYKIHSALASYSGDSQVEESALIWDRDAKKDVEVDILVTFTAHGSTYRTAIECRDHSRKASPAWIRELVTKRESCRLDKVIAVHSLGFSDGAIDLAESRNIETVHLADCSKLDWARSLFDRTKQVFGSVEVMPIVPSPRGYGFRLDRNISLLQKGDVAAAVLEIAGEKSGIPMTEHVENERYALESETMDQLNSIEISEAGLPRTLDLERLVALRAKFPHGTQIRHETGSLRKAFGSVHFYSISLYRVVLEPSRFFQYGDDRVVEHANEGLKVADLVEPESVNSTSVVRGESSKPRQLALLPYESELAELVVVNRGRWGARGNVGEWTVQGISDKWGFAMQSSPGTWPPSVTVTGASRVQRRTYKKRKPRK